MAYADALQMESNLRMAPAIIHDRRREYYDAINAYNNMVESRPFVTFMLSANRLLRSWVEEDKLERFLARKIYKYWLVAKKKHIN